jgi:hypothetical protein
MKIGYAILVLCGIVLLVFPHTCGLRHTPDAVLERAFRAHQTEFEALLAEVQKDSKLVTVQRHVLIYGGQTVDLRESDLSAIERTGLPIGRWRHYQDELERLGLYGVMKDGSRIEFRVDAGTLFNGDSYKGFEYRAYQPPHIRVSLDDYRISDEDKTQFRGWLVYKTLNEHWYLYLFVDG